MQLCLGVFPIQSWCAEWLQQMAAKVRLVKCANIRKVLAEYLASYADCCGLTLTYMKYACRSSRGSSEASKTRLQSHLHKDLMTEKDDN